MISKYYYVVVVRYKGIWYTLQTNNKCNWAFFHEPKMYQRLDFAKKAAKKVRREFQNDDVYVFKCVGLELIGSDSYNKWKDKEERVALHLLNKC
jgi:hypothetical protein